MNQNLKQHEEFLESLKYYDSTNFITKTYSIQSEPTSSLSYSETKWNNKQIINNDISEVFSMTHTKQFNQIKEFIQSKAQNLPLLIKGPRQAGKKTLICQIMQQYKKTPEQIKSKIFISNFSCVNKVYSQILYNIMVKMRMIFAINQKVQANEQKIRRYFKYWLDITSENIQKNNLGCQKNQKETLIIIIDGIDQLTNSRGEKVFPEFWLPQKMPKNIKLILSGTADEIVIERLSQTTNVRTLIFQQRNLSQKSKKTLNLQIQQILLNRNISFFEIKTIQKFITINQQLKISPNDTFDEILQNYIQKSSSESLSTNQIKSLLLCLCLSKKGLTESQLQKIMKMKPVSINEFLNKFEPVIQNYKEYYIVLNSKIKRFIQQNYDPKNQKKQIYHEAIAKVLKRDQMSIRKLEEEIHHLSQAQKNFQIKQIVAEIQSFLILYTPPCKYILCSAWKKLQQTLNSDPVFEYNKSVQSFLGHYHPKEQQLFKIIYQLSMFFREYSDFEGAKIPVFRHPLIKGEQQQLNQISVHGELKQLKMIASMKQFQKKKLQQSIKPKTTQIQKQKQSIKAMKSPRNNRIRQSINSQIEFSSNNNNETSKNQMNSIQNNSQGQVNSVQKLNLQIKSNRQKFHQHYLSILKPYLKEYYVPIKKLYLNDTFIKEANDDAEMDQDDQFEEDFIQLTDIFPVYNFNKIKSSLILKNLDEYFEQSYHREQTTKFYYYKEWIWIQFPWICQSLNSNFSEMIEEHISKPTQYMSIDKQLKFIKDVLKISQVSKQNKTSIYEKKKIQIHSIELKKNQRKSMKVETASITDSTRKDYKKEKENPPKKIGIFSNKLRDSHTEEVQKDKNKKKEKNNHSELIANDNNDNHINNRSLNFAKFKLNMSNIDQKINEQQNKQFESRLRYDSKLMSKVNSRLTADHNINFNTLEGTYLTEISGNYAENNNTNKLPYLMNQFKESRLSKNHQNQSLNHSMLKSFESYQNRTKRQMKQLNDLVNENLRLKRQIQELQKTSIMMKSIDLVSQNNLNLNKLKQLENVKQKMLKKQQIQAKLRAKLETIIKICDNNQSHEKQSQILGNWLQNLKLMTNHEKQIMQTGMKSFQAYLDQYKIQYKQVRQRKQKLENQLKDYQQLYVQDEDEDEGITQKQESYGYTDRTYVTRQQADKSKIQNSQMKKVQINNVSLLNESSLTNNNTMKKYGKSLYLNKNKSKHKKNTSNLIKCQKMFTNDLYQELADLFSLPFDEPSAKDEGYNYDQLKQTSKYLLQQFEEKIQKLSELEMNFEDIKYENEQLMSRLKELQKTINSNHNQKSSNRQISGEVIEKRKILNDIRSRVKQVQTCMKQYIQIL